MKKLFTLFVAMMTSLTMWAEVVGGTDGNITWSLDGGVLTLSGEGAMKDYTGYDMPWTKYQQSIYIVNIKPGITSIGNWAFSNCQIYSFTLPEGVTSIGEYAFFDCRSLYAVQLSDGVLSIGNRAFYHCPTTHIIIPESVTTIGDEAFCSVQNIIYNGGLELEGAPWSANRMTTYALKEGDFLFKDKEKTILSLYIGSDKYITIPDGVTNIENSTFKYCSNLIYITIPESVTHIDNDTFINVKHIAYNGEAEGSPWGATSVNGVIENGFIFEDETKTVLKAYIGTDTEIIIPDGVTIIGDYVFELNHEITYVKIPDGVTSIGDGAFYDCFGLKTINIPESVTSIGDQAFRLCFLLTSITIPANVTSIGSMAFSECFYLTSVTIPDGVTNIGYDAFLYINHITYNGEAEGSPWGAMSVNGVIENGLVYEDETKTVLKAYIGTDAEISIPDGVTSIGDRAFSECLSLTSLSIPDGVTSIGEFALLDCSNLTELISKSQTAPILSDYVFSGTTIQTIYIPAGATASYREKWGTQHNYVEMPSLEGDEANDIEVSIVDCSATSITVRLTTKSPIDIAIIVNGVKISITNLKALSNVSAVHNADDTYTINGVQTGDVIKFVANSDTPINDILANPEAIEGIYNLQGQKLDAPQRGINIINGRKVVVR